MTHTRKRVCVQSRKIALRACAPKAVHCGDFVLNPVPAEGRRGEGGSSFSVEEALRRWDFTSQHALAQEFLASQMAHI